MRIVRSIFLVITFLIISSNSYSQIFTPVTWENTSRKVSNDTYELIFKAKIQKGWHMYGLNIADGGPVRTSINFKDNSRLELIGNAKTSIRPVKKYDSIFAMDVELFDGTVTFTQKIKVKKPRTRVVGYVEFMVCDDARCLPPTENEFDFTLGEAVATTENDVNATTKIDSNSLQNSNGDAIISQNTTGNQTSGNEGVIDDKGKNSKKSLWLVFWEAVAKGILSVFTPCVFPIIPLIVAFFMRDNTTRKRIIQALMFGFTIVAFYTLTGLIAGLAKIDLTVLGKNWIANLTIFVLLFLVALSFFGMFEIMLPGNLSNKLDQQVDKGGVLAPFFLALATVVVSFSCVGPIAGLAIGSALKGEIVEPVVAMLGFSLSFSAPFMVIGIFPGLLKKLPKSGGWLNAVKVVFAFVILASSMAFLSNVGWKFLTRDIVLSVDIVTFVLLGFYLLGKIKFPHDSDLPFVKVPRFMLAVLAFSVAIYLIPGLFGSPLKAVSAFLPSTETSEFRMNALQSSGLNPVSSTVQELCDTTPKYSGKYHLPYNLPSYFDYNEGLACAKEKNKPVLLYFTGYACKNCKKMYSEVWSDPNVMDKLRNDFIIISLYVDDYTELHANDKYISKQSNKEIKTVAKKNLEHEIDRYGTNSQPLFVIMNFEEKLLTRQETYTYSSSTGDFLAFLDEGIQNFNKIVK